MRSGLYVMSGALIGFSTLAAYSQSSYWSWGIAAGICGAGLAAFLDHISEVNK